MKNNVIIDYGLSNLRSVENTFKYLGANVYVSSKKEDIIHADSIILPGVGAFSDGMTKLKELNLIDAIDSKVRDDTPLLGICLGMQLLFEESEEFGVHRGLALIPGRVEKIPSENTIGEKQPIPHISWDPLYPSCSKNSFKGSFLENIDPGDECYFIHSYEVKVNNQDNCLAETIYGGRRICAAVQKNNIIGTQFHPEKSGEVGLLILKKIIELYL